MGAEGSNVGDKCTTDVQCEKIGNYCHEDGPTENKWTCEDGSNVKDTGGDSKKHISGCNYDSDCARMNNVCEVDHCYRGLYDQPCCDKCTPPDPCYAGGVCHDGGSMDFEAQCTFEDTLWVDDKGPSLSSCKDGDPNCELASTGAI